MRYICYINTNLDFFSIGVSGAPSLLFDLHDAAWRPRDPITALATPSPSASYGCSAGNGSLVALASLHSLILLDTRCTRAPLLQWNLPPAVAPCAQPRHFLSFSRGSHGAD